MKWSPSIFLLALLVLLGCEKTPPAPAKSPSPAASAPPASTPGSQPASSSAQKTNAEGKIIESPGSRIDPVPDDLPLPPGMTLLTSVTTPGAKQTSRTIYGQLPEEKDVAKVAQWFTDELPKHGWQVKPGPPILPGSNRLDIDKEGIVGTVAVYQKPESAGTVVQLQTSEATK